MNDDQKTVLTLFSRRVAAGSATEDEMQFMIWYAQQDVDISDAGTAEMVCDQVNNFIS